MNKCALVFLIALIPLTDMGQILTYQLLPDSTITPQSGATVTGPSQPLSGYFTWVPYVPSDIVGSDTFNITSLNFTSVSYSLTLANSSQPDNITKIGTDGATALNADVNWAGSAQNPWFIGAYGSGSYVGPATAPTQLIFNAEGMAPGGGGYFVAGLYIHASLVPEPATESLVLMAATGLAFLRLRPKRSELCYSRH